MHLMEEMKNIVLKYILVTCKQYHFGKLKVKQLLEPGQRDTNKKYNSPMVIIQIFHHLEVYQYEKNIQVKEYMD